MNKITHLVVLLLLVAAFQPGFAQVEKRAIGFHAIGGDLSFVKPENIDGGIGFEVKADIGDLMPNIALMPSVQYWQSSIGLGGLTAADVDVSEFSINGDLVYAFQTGTSSFEPYAGAGLGLVFTSVDVGGVSVGNDGSGFGLNLFGGAKIPVSSFDAFGEVRFRVGSSSYDTFAIKGGVMFPLN